MQGTLKIALILVVLIYIFCILKAVKKKKMKIRYLIIWAIIGIGFIIALLIPNLVENISKFIGFEIPINMIFSGAIFLILFLIFDLMISVSKEQNKNVLLIQEISMLKKRVKELEKR